MSSAETRKAFQGTQLWIDGDTILDIVEDSKLKKGELKILLMIASRDWGGKEGVCKMTSNDFAEVLKCERATAQKMVRSLQSLGYIQQIYRVKMNDSKVKSTTSWKQAALWNAEGKILRSFFRVSKHGIRGRKLTSKHKNQNIE